MVVVREAIFLVDADVELIGSLDEIQGVGPAKKRALLRKFGSVKGMRDATEADLAGVAGVGPALAERIKQAIE